MTLNGVMAVTLRYFTEFGKPALQKTICGGIYARVYCIFSACTMSSQRKFTFAILSPDEFLVIFCQHRDNLIAYMVIGNMLVLCRKHFYFWQKEENILSLPIFAKFLDIFFC